MTETSIAPWQARDVALSLCRTAKVRNLPARSKQTGTRSKGDQRHVNYFDYRHADCFVAGLGAREPARDWPTFVRLPG
jgi:hypothetical protein